MLETLANIFYDPWLFWTLPLVPAAVLAGVRRWRSRARRR